MPDPWKRYYTFVELRLIAQGVPAQLTDYQLVNDARNSAVLGTLTLTQDEYAYLSGHIVPDGDQVEYQKYLTAVLTNTPLYSANGRKMDTFSLKEQLDLINATWDSGRLLTPDP